MSGDESGAPLEEDQRPAPEGNQHTERTADSSDTSPALELAVGGSQPAAGPSSCCPCAVGEFAQVYLQRGWAPIPLPPLRKLLPLSGWTGGSAPYPDAAQVQALRGSGHADGNIALRMRPGQLGVDVDAYDGKPGARTLREWQEHLGDELPGTWISTSRLEEHDGVLSGIRHYRLPPGVSTEGWAGGAPGIEFIRQGHRYAVAPPAGAVHHS